MDTTKLTKLAMARRRLDAQVKAAAAATTEQNKPLKAKIEKIDTVLGKVINKSGKEGTMKSFNLPDATVYASTVDMYSVKDREELDLWVLQPLVMYLDIEADLLGDEAEEALADLVKVLGEVKERLGIFPNKVVKDSAIAYRKDTGASELDGEDLKGGKLPGGVGMYKDHKVNYRKAK